MKNRRLTIIISIVALLLVIPFVANMLSDEVNWTIFDFLIAAALLLSSGFAIDFVLRKVKKKKHRIVFSLLIVIALLLIWAELAVGVFGTVIAGS